MIKLQHRFMRDEENLILPWEKRPTSAIVVKEYPDLPLDNKVVGIAIAEINGVYPSKDQWSRNKEVDMWYLCVEGKGKIQFSSGEIYRLEKDVLLHIQKNQCYRVSGNLKVVIITIPPWYPKQYEWVRSENNQF